MQARELSRVPGPQRHRSMAAEVCQPSTWEGDEELRPSWATRDPFSLKMLFPKALASKVITLEINLQYRSIFVGKCSVHSSTSERTYFLSEAGSF